MQRGQKLGAAFTASGTWGPSVCGLGGWQYSWGLLRLLLNNFWILCCHFLCTNVQSIGVWDGERDMKSACSVCVCMCVIACIRAGAIPPSYPSSVVQPLYYGAALAYSVEPADGVRILEA